MRSAAGSVSRRGKGRWLVQVTLPNGKRRSRTVRGSRTDAERTKAAMLLEAGDSAQDITLGHLILDIYLPHARQKVREGTYSHYESYGRAIAESELGTWPLSTLPAHVDDIREWLDALPTRGGARNAYKVLRQALGHARRSRHINVEMVTDLIEQPRTDPPAKPTVTLATIAEYLACCKDSDIYPGIVVSLAVGTRRSETCALDWADIAWERGPGWFGWFRVARGLHERAGGGTYTEPPKSRASERTVYLPEWAGEILHPLRGDGPLMEHDGERVRPDWLSREWARCQRAACLQHVPLKNLRHSCGTILLRELSVPVSDVQQLHGHASSTVTERFYVQQTNVAAERSAAAWGPAARADSGGAGAERATSQLFATAPQREKSR